MFDIKLKIKNLLKVDIYLSNSTAENEQINRLIPSILPYYATLEADYLAMVDFMQQLGNPLRKAFLFAHHDLWSRKGEVDVVNSSMKMLVESSIEYLFENRALNLASIEELWRLDLKGDDERLIKDIKLNTAHTNIMDAIIYLRTHVFSDQKSLIRDFLKPEIINMKKLTNSREVQALNQSFENLVEQIKVHTGDLSGKVIERLDSENCISDCASLLEGINFIEFNNYSSDDPYIAEPISALVHYCCAVKAAGIVRYSK
jgi:hypothetical protein